MKIAHLVKIGFFLLCLMQMIFAVSAEGRGEYLEAIYEMLWLIVFLFLLDREFRENK